MAPIKLRLIPDRFHLRHVGHLKDGRGIWLDTQITFDGAEIRDFVCAYVFDPDGELVEWDIVALGGRTDQQPSARKTIRDLKRRFGWTRSGAFDICLFTVDAHGETFGLELRDPDDTDEDEQSIDVLPGYTLNFYPPWDEGAYDS